MSSRNKKRLMFYIGLYLLVGLLLFLFQRKFLYYPTARIDHPYGRISVENDGESIEVIVLNQGKEKAILYFGGNGESVVYNGEDFLRTFPEHTVYLVNYRGYGGSSGSPEEQGLYSDALQIFEKLTVAHSTVSIIGRSMGSGIATFLAAGQNVEKLVLVTPFDSMQSVAQGKMPIYPMALLFRDKYDSLGRVGSIKAKTMLIIAGKDEIIPRKNSMRLANAFPQSQVSVKTVEGSGHNNLSTFREYHALLGQFFR